MTKGTRFDFLSLVGVRLLLLGVGAYVFGRFIAASAEAVGSHGQLIGMGAMQLVIILAFFNVGALQLPSFCWRKGCMLGGVLAAAVAVVLVGALYQFLDAVGLHFPEQYSVEMLRLAHGPNLALMVILSVVGAPLAEELYLRGWWLQYLRCKIGGRRAVVLLALVFALIHGCPAAYPGLFILGIVLGVAAIRWGVSAAVIGHMLFNLTTVIAVRGGWV